jgi:hypothetical protein
MPAFLFFLTATDSRAANVQIIKHFRRKLAILDVVAVAEHGND